MAKTPEQEAKAVLKEFRLLTDFVKDYLVLLDDAMRKPESAERGRRIAQLSNQLNMKNDTVQRFVLNLDFNGKPLKRKAA